MRWLDTIQLGQLNKHWCGEWIWFKNWSTLCSINCSNLKKCTKEFERRYHISNTSLLIHANKVTSAISSSRAMASGESSPQARFHTAKQWERSFASLVGKSHCLINERHHWEFFFVYSSISYRAAAAMLIPGLASEKSMKPFLLLLFLHNCCWLLARRGLNKKRWNAAFTMVSAYADDDSPSAI